LDLLYQVPPPRYSFAPLCSCCLVSHIRRGPEAETKHAAEASEAAVAAAGGAAEDGPGQRRT